MLLEPTDEVLEENCEPELLTAVMKVDGGRLVKEGDVKLLSDAPAVELESEENGALLKRLELVTVSYVIVDELIVVGAAVVKEMNELDTSVALDTSAVLDIAGVLDTASVEDTGVLDVVSVEETGVLDVVSVEETGVLVAADVLVAANVLDAAGVLDILGVLDAASVEEADVLDAADVPDVVGALERSVLIDELELPDAEGLIDELAVLNAPDVLDGRSVLNDVELLTKEELLNEPEVLDESRPLDEVDVLKIARVLDGIAVFDAAELLGEELGTDVGPTLEAPEDTSREDEPTGKVVLTELLCTMLDWVEVMTEELLCGVLDGAIDEDAVEDTGVLELDDKTVVDEDEMVPLCTEDELCIEEANCELLDGVVGADDELGAAEVDCELLEGITVPVDEVNCKLLEVVPDVDNKLDCKLLDEVPGDAEELTVDKTKLLEVPMTVLLCVVPPMDDDDGTVTEDEVPRVDEVEDCTLSGLTEEDTRSVAEDETIEEDDETPGEVDVKLELDAKAELLNTEDEPIWEEEVLPTELDPAGACTH
ncbi:uncharacterized protein N0V89_005330 [Didymosphaeria variabile]|uniref:Uncharacterized protein n=1 Tax=Didymosphaeria variabile TaxID=1932322 RepID=A0A9W9CB67_9PLEO|nr:uncharacterized protein N0V89_005330 [Didymosphaeria variabile]KAJ4353600.1 hypothetical protein N0V89_005330 [Didymosphaeria variabile]